MYAIKQFYLKLFNAKTTMKDKTMMCDETKNECCNHADPPWEGPQVIPAQIRRVDNLIFRKINQFARENDVEQATDRKSTRLNSSHASKSRMPSSA